MESEIQQNEMDGGLVLVVDDSPATQAHLKSMLCKKGYEISVVGLGADAFSQAKANRPHLILLDVMLPDMSGYEVCRQLKADPETNDIPIVFVSGLTDVDERLKGLQLGALDYISKPIEKKILLTKVQIFVQLCRDARMLKSMHDRLQDSHTELQQFYQALDNASDAVVITAPSGEITYSNCSFQLLARFFPKQPEDLQITHYFTDQDAIIAASENALKGVAHTQELMLKRGTMELPVLVKCSTIMSEDEQPSGMMFLIIDLTERKNTEADHKRLEMELYQSQKLESVGQLAAGIAHEINTPVQFVGDNIRFIQDSLQDLFDLQVSQQALLEAAKKGGIDPALTDAVEQALETADVDYLQEELPVAISQSLDGMGRVASIVRAMKEFAHPGTTEKKPADLNEAIQTTITVARNKWKYVAVLETEFDDDLPLVPCLVGEFNQVILNLIVNASDAIGDIVNGTGGMGKITISTQYSDNGVEVRVKDTGGGIPAKIQSRIFDPFFTTKEVGKGSGQGLAIAHGVIVNKHQGEFRFESEDGKGTTFIIQLPLEAAA